MEGGGSDNVARFERNLCRTPCFKMYKHVLGEGSSHTHLAAKGLVESVAFEQENGRLEKKNKVNQSHHRALTKDHKQ